MIKSNISKCTRAKRADKIAKMYGRLIRDEGEMRGDILRIKRENGEGGG